MADAFDFLVRNHRKVQHPLSLLIPDKAASNGPAECLETAYSTIHAISRSSDALTHASAIESIIPRE